MKYKFTLKRLILCVAALALFCWVVRGLFPYHFLPYDPGVAVQSPEQDWTTAIRAGLTLDGCDPDFVEAVQCVDRRHGTLRFDESGKLIGVDLAGDRVSVSDADVALLAPFENLRILKISGPVTRQSVDVLSDLSNLSELFLQDAQITDADLTQLATLSRLESLTLRRCSKVTDAGLSHLIELPKLSRLFLPDNGFSNDAMDAIARLTGLTFLDLRGCPAIDGEGVKRLSGLESLSGIRLGGMQVEDDVLATLAELPNLRSVTLEDGLISDQGLAKLVELELSELTLSRCLNLTEEGLEQLQRVDTLRSLALRDLAILDLGWVAPRAGLEVLKLQEIMIGDEALVHLKSLPMLKQLELRQAFVSDEGMNVLAEMPTLERLVLQDIMMTDAGVAALAQNDSLRTLDLSDMSAVTDSSIDSLGRMVGLTSLRLDHTGITQDGQERLQELLPQCQVVWTGAGVGGM